MIKNGPPPLCVLHSYITYIYTYYIATISHFYVAVAIFRHDLKLINGKKLTCTLSCIFLEEVFPCLMQACVVKLVLSLACCSSARLSRRWADEMTNGSVERLVCVCDYVWCPFRCTQCFLMARGHQYTHIHKPPLSLCERGDKSLQ